MSILVGTVSPRRAWVAKDSALLSQRKGEEAKDGYRSVCVCVCETDFCSISCIFSLKKKSDNPVILAAGEVEIGRIAV
jgi:hypothetical protein